MRGIAAGPWIEDYIIRKLWTTTPRLSTSDGNKIRKSVKSIRFGMSSSLLDATNIYAAEYNKPELHDRVLVFDIMRNGWEQCAKVDPPRVVVCDAVTEANQQLADSEGCNVEQRANKSTSEDLLEQKEKCSTSRMASSRGSLQPGRRRSQRDFSTSSPESKRKKNPIASKCSNLKTEDGGDLDHTLITSECWAANVDKITSSCLETVNDADSSIIRQHKRYVHSSFLAVQSSYFRALFYSEMEESRTKEVHLKIPVNEEKVHLILLEAIYRPEILNTVSVDETLTVLQLADRYDVSLVFRNCTNLLEGKARKLKICEKVMKVLSKCNMTAVETLEKEIKDFLCRKFSPLDTSWQYEDFEKLSVPLLKTLLSSNDLVTQSENTVFHALMHWIEFNKFDVSKDDTSSMLSLVRFELLSVDYLVNVVQHHPVATQVCNFKDLYLRGINYRALTPELRRSLDNDSLPVLRRESEKEILQYTWLIEKESLATLQNANRLTSEAFWCCGYQLQLSMKENTLEKNTSKNYRVYLFLHAISLSQCSVLPLTWTASIKSSFSRTKTMRKRQTFTANSELDESCIEATLTNGFILEDTESIAFTDDLMIDLMVKLK